MRAVTLVLMVLVLAGCAQPSPGTPTADDQVMPADFAGKVSYGNGSVAPPYHYGWRLTFDASTAVVEWTPGYDETFQPWRESVDITGERRAALYERLRDLGVFDMAAATDDDMVGGPTGTVEITANGRTHDPGTLGLSEDSGQLLDDVVAAVEKFVPADVWDGLRARQDDWAAAQK